MEEDSGTTEEKKIFELTDIYEDHNGSGRRASDSRNNQEVIVVDGRGYERIKQDKNIQDLTEIVEDRPPVNNLNEEVIKQTREITERIAREIIPEIAERVIREEIEKLKKASQKESAAVN